MDRYSNIRDWIDDLPKRGKITFSKEEIEREFPNLRRNNIQLTLFRLARKKKIQSVWRGFWVVVPVEYGLKGVVDPIEYVAQLMAYLGQNYYIGLLSAAAMHGAAHQQPMELMLITQSRHLKDTKKSDTKINFSTKKEIPHQYVQQITSRSGYIAVSTPELTAIDLLLYVKSVGGINRVATVLSELAEIIDFDRVSISFFQNVHIADIQRLGYLLETVGFPEIAEQLYRKTIEAKIKFRKYPLCIKRKAENLSDFEVNEKWKIIVNEEIDID